MRLLAVIFFSIIYSLTSCGVKPVEDDSVPLWDSTFSETGVDGKLYEIAEKSDRYDSAQFKIMKGYYISKKVCYESYTDSILGIRFEKHYRPNGGISEEGSMYVNDNYHVGIWKYYYPDGRTKEINFDSTIQTSYFNALQIAKSHGYNKGRLEVSEELYEGTYYWKITEWIEENSEGGKGKYILIRRSNGKITIPQSNDVKYLI